MRILHLLGSDADTGGILTVLRSVQEASAPRGWRHTVLVNRRYCETRAPGLEYRYSRFLLAESPRLWALLGRGLLAWFELERLLRKEPATVLHCHARGALATLVLAAYRARRTALFHNHGYARHTSLYRRAAALGRIHTVLLTPNMARHYGLSGAPRLHLISECCADACFDEPLIGRPGPPVSGSPVELVGLGNLVGWKNWDLAVRAMAGLPAAERGRFRLTVYGPTPADVAARRYAAGLERLVGELGLSGQVRFPGATSRVREVLQAADAFLLPSTNEPCSVALIEALALGRPAIVSASGGNVDVVEDGRTGVLFRPDDVGDLTRQLRRWGRGEVVLAAPGIIRESVRARSARAVVAELAALYEGLLRRAGSADIPEETP